MEQSAVQAVVFGRGAFCDLMGVWDRLPQASWVVFSVGCERKTMGEIAHANLRLRREFLSWKEHFETKHEPNRHRNH